MKKPKIQFNPFADMDHLRFGQPVGAATAQAPPVIGEHEGLVRHRQDEAELEAELQRRRAVLALIDSGEELVRCEERLKIVGGSEELAASLEEARVAARAGGLRSAFDKMRRGGVDKELVVQELERRLGVAGEIEQRIELLRTRPESVRAREQLRIIALEHRLEQNRVRQRRMLAQDAGEPAEVRAGSDAGVPPEGTAGSGAGRPAEGGET
jgi:hypothetical protein